MPLTSTLSERAEALEERQLRELGDRLVTKSLLYNLADGDQSLGNDNSPSSHMWRTLRRPCNAL